jgi:adenosyl cobinamide kinase/adenosyl cobinamide phosphate guanylyltransferase
MQCERFDQHASNRSAAWAGKRTTIPAAKDNLLLQIVLLQCLTGMQRAVLEGERDIHYCRAY